MLRGMLGKNKMEDNAKYPLLNIKNKFDRVVIIGGGFNAIEHKEAIKSFIETHTNTAIIFATARYAREYLDVNLFLVYFSLYIRFRCGDNQFVFCQFHAPCLVFDGGCFHVGLFYKEFLLLSQTESGCAFILDCQVEVFSVDRNLHLAVVGTYGKGDLSGSFVNGYIEIGRAHV